MPTTTSVFKVSGDLPNEIQAGETLLLKFKVELTDIEFGSLADLQVGFVARQSTTTLLNTSSPIDLDEQTPTSISGSLPIDTIALVPYADTGAVDVGWYVTDGQYVSYSVRGRSRVREALVIPATSPSGIIILTVEDGRALILENGLLLSLTAPVPVGGAA